MISTFPKREPWKKDRKNSVGASETAFVNRTEEIDEHLPKWASELTIWGDKTGEEVFDPGVIRQEEATTFESGAEIFKVSPLKLGTKLEAGIMEIACDAKKRRSIDKPPLMIIRPDDSPHEHSTPDGFVIDPKKGLGVGEIKLVVFSGNYKESIPLHVMMQNQQAFKTCHESKAFRKKYGEPQFCFIAALLPFGNVMVLDMEPQEDLQREMSKGNELFWSKVENRIMPEPRGIDAEKSVFTREYKKRGDVYLPEEFNAIAEEWDEKSDQEKEIKEWKSLQKLRILKAAIEGEKAQDAITDSNKALVEDGSGWTIVKVGEKDVSAKPAYKKKGYVYPKRTGRPK